MDYATAVQVLRDSGQTVNLVVKRRVVLPAPQAASSAEQTVRVNLVKNKKKEDFGIVLGCRIFVKEIAPRSLADRDGTIREGDLVHKINGASIDGLTLKEARKVLDAAKDKLDFVVKRDPFGAAKPTKQPSPKMTNGHKDPYGEGGYKANNPAIYSPGKMSGYAESSMAPPRPPMPMEEGTCTSGRVCFYLRRSRRL